MTAPPRFLLPKALEAELRRHCEAQYPNEACGALIGRGDGGTSEWFVAEVRGAPNEHGDDRTRRYLVPPEFQLQVERHAEATGQDVLGFYHSHPDHPARPSGYDLDHAWPGYLYLICAVARGRSTDLDAFTLVEDGSAFQDVEALPEPGADE